MLQPGKGRPENPLVDHDFPAFLLENCWIQLIGFVGKNYRKIPYFMGKSMVSCRFSLQLIHWWIIHCQLCPRRCWDGSTASRVWCSSAHGSGLTEPELIIFFGPKVAIFSREKVGNIGRSWMNRCCFWLNTLFQQDHLEISRIYLAERTSSDSPRRNCSNETISFWKVR